MTLSNQPAVLVSRAAVMGPGSQLADKHRENFTPHFIEDILRPPDSLSLGAREAGRQKKMRTTFTGRQIFIMEKMFETKKYLNATERSHLSRLYN